ncbi:MAG: beta-galactosidase, partial [Pseudomonadota bacterium]
MDLRVTGARLALPGYALERYLATTVPGFAGPLSIHQFSGGQSNPTYRLETPGRSYVLRRKPPGVLLPSAHAIDREYRVMAALGPTGLPVPPMLHYCEDEAVIGSAFYVMGFVAGRVVFDTTLPDLPPAERRATYEALVDTLAALHQVEPAAVGLAGFGRPGGYVARQVARWSKQYRASETPEQNGPIPEMAYLMDWLPGAVETLAEAGLKIILGTPTATPPRWMLTRHPDMLAWDREGRPRRFGSRRHYCFSHLGYRGEAARIATLMAERYGRHEAVIAWQIDNEYGCHDTTLSFSPAAGEGFRA